MRATAFLTLAQWCVDCTDWQIKTENGETLPAPGSQLSVEEMHPRLPDPARLRDDMIFESGFRGASDAEVALFHRRFGTRVPNRV